VVAGAAAAGKAAAGSSGGLGGDIEVSVVEAILQE